MRSLVRDDLQHWVAATGAVLALVTGSPFSIATCYAPCFLLCQLSWFVLRQPAAFFTSWKLDATISTYTASLAVWLSLGIMACSFVLSALTEAGLSSGGGGVAQQAMTTLLVALGVGAQPILTNFNLWAAPRALPPLSHRRRRAGWRRALHRAVDHRLLRHGHDL